MTERPIALAAPDVGAEELDAARRVLRSGRLAQGPEVEAFERELADGLSGTQHAVAVSSGTAALELAIAALGIGQGDEVVTTPFTFAATVNAVLRSGAIAVLADIGDDFDLDPSAAAAAVTSRTRAILAVHLYGLPADVSALEAIGPPVLEDAAQAHLAMLDGRKVGGLGVAGCFSFYATKNLTTGEGGALTTDDGEIARRARVLRDQGMTGPYEYELVGTNQRMTELAAALGRAQLAKLPAATSARARVASMLADALGGLAALRLPTVPRGRVHAWHQFTVRLDPGVDREAVVGHLALRGIESRAYYPRILADIALYEGHPRVVPVEPLDRARDAARTVLSLPVHPGVTEEDVERIAAALAEALAAARPGMVGP